MTEVKNNIQNQEKDEFLKISLVNQGISIKKNRVDPLSDVPDKDIDYKNLELLNKYISERDSFPWWVAATLKIIQGRTLAQPRAENPAGK